MTIKTRLSIAALLLIVGCSGTTVSPDVSDVPPTGLDSLDDVAVDPSDSVDEETHPRAKDAAEPDGGQQPTIGSPCDDENPCSFGEDFQADGSCAGGTEYQCDDGRSCTDDSCDGLGDCLFTIMDGHCLIAGECLASGDVLPGGCGSCQPGVTATKWTPLEDGEACDDGDPCTSDDLCTGGFCSGSTTDCADDNPCTEDQCDPLSGCVNKVLSGIPCGEETLCQQPGICLEGECQGVVSMECDDDNPCTADDCDPGDGCVHEPLDGFDCSDGDICNGSDLCDGAECVGGGAPLSCDDGNECTADFCHPVSGCFHELAENPCCDDAGVNICDDGNWCTTDSCDPDTGACFNTPNVLPCNDGDPCTGPDVCSDGTCAGPAVDCDDANPCTTDSCDPAEGCLHAPLSDLPCDDGLDCSTGDACVDGTCLGNMDDCGCQPEFSPFVNRLNSLVIGEDATAGNGLDVDGNPATCSPAPCEAGIDNALSMLGGFANDALAKAVADGAVILLFEHRDFSAQGDAFMLDIYIGESAEPDCDIQASTCDYLVSAASFDDACSPLVYMDNATVVGTKLTAGGPGYNFSFPLPLAEGVLLDLVLYHAQISASVSFADGGPAALDGVMGGAVSKADMIAAIEQVPEESLPMDKAMILSLIDMMVVPDIDTNGDGGLDAASIGLPFAAIAGHIVGTTP